MPAGTRGSLSLSAPYLVTSTALFNVFNKPVLHFLLLVLHSPPFLLLSTSFIAALNKPESSSSSSSPPPPPPPPPSDRDQSNSFTMFCFFCFRSKHSERSGKQRNFVTRPPPPRRHRRLHLSLHTLTHTLPQTLSPPPLFSLSSLASPLSLILSLICHSLSLYFFCPGLSLSPPPPPSSYSSSSWPFSPLFSEAGGGSVSGGKKSAAISPPPPIPSPLLTPSCTWTFSPPKSWTPYKASHLARLRNKKKSRK